MKAASRSARRSAALCGAAYALLLFLDGCASRRPAKTAAEESCDLHLGQVATYLVRYVQWTDQAEFLKAEVSLDRAGEQLDLARYVCPPAEIAKFEKPVAAARADLAANLAKYGSKLGR